jgi:hypothetical protein
MAGAWATIDILDATGTTASMRVWDESGTGDGPFSFGQTITKGDGTALWNISTAGTALVSLFTTAGAAVSSFTVTQATGANLNASVTGAVAVTQATAANLNTNVSQATAANLNATVVQATAANLNATIVGNVAATSGTLTVTQATAANLNATIVGNVAATSGTLTVTQSTAANLNAQVQVFTTAGSPVTFNANGQVGSTASAPVVLATNQTFTTGALFPVGPAANRTMKGVNLVTIATTTETSIVTGASGLFYDLYGLVLANSSATASTVLIKDATAGTSRMEFIVPAGETRGFMVDGGSAVTQSATAHDWTATLGTSVASVFVTALYVKNV